jgi:HemX protein
MDFQLARGQAMFTERWAFDFAIYAYVLSLLFRYAALLRPNRQARIISSSLLIVIWLVLTIAIIMRFIDVNHYYGQVDPLLMYTWALISITLCIAMFFRLDLFVFCASLIGITMLAIHLFVIQTVGIAAPAGVISDLIFVHITLAITAYAAFSLAGICAMLYLISHHLLKRKKWNLLLRRLSSLDQLDRFSFWLVGIGLLLLFISMILGAIWTYKVYGQFHWTDIKVIGSIALLIVYTTLFSMTWTRWISTQKVAWWLIISMILVVINYFLSQTSFSFHHWSS